jgi:heme exporter protein CcmD
MTNQLLYVILAFGFAVFSLTLLAGLTMFREKSIRQQLKQWQEDDA